MTYPGEPRPTPAVGNAGCRVPVWRNDKAWEEGLMLDCLCLDHGNKVGSGYSLHHDVTTYEIGQRGQGDHKRQGEKSWEGKCE